jgi:hypothetical protein
MSRRLLKSTVSFMVLAAALPGIARAGDFFSAPSSLAAVSAVNGKIGAFAGDVSGEWAFGALGSVALPAGPGVGLQFDGMIGSAGGAGFWGLGGHVFKRDPNRGLIGLYGSYVDWSYSSVLGGATVSKLALEGEKYMGRLTLEGLFGWQSGSFVGITFGATAAYYVNDNLRFDAGYRYLQGPGSSLAVGMEWMPGPSGLSLFANGGFGFGVDNSYLWGGVKFYTGPQKSLIRRHREDDPDVTLPKDLFLGCFDGEVLVSLAVAVDGSCGVPD